MRKPMMTAGVVIVAAVAIAACGSSSPSSGATTAATGAPASAPASGGKAKTVDLQQESGVGKVLVDSSGMAVYTNDAEASGKVVCTTSSGCTSFWKPITIASGKPNGAGDVGKLGTIKRPEGTTQLTINGQPVYTFVSDSSGKVTGNGFTDHFGGHKFVWHALASGGKAAASSSSPTPTTSGSGGSSGGGSGGGYGY